MSAVFSRLCHSQLLPLFLFFMNGFLNDLLLILISPCLFLCFLLKRKRESFTADVSVADGHLVLVPPPSSHLDTRDKLWCLHSALLQCHMLMERAITREEKELDSGRMADYETQRKMVKDRLSLLLINTGELLKGVDGAAVQTPSVDGLQVSGELDRNVQVMMMI